VTRARQKRGKVLWAARTLLLSNAVANLITDDDLQGSPDSAGTAPHHSRYLRNTIRSRLTIFPADGYEQSGSCLLSELDLDVGSSDNSTNTPICVGDLSLIRKRALVTIPRLYQPRPLPARKWTDTMFFFSSQRRNRCIYCSAHSNHPPESERIRYEYFAFQPLLTNPLLRIDSNSLQLVSLLMYMYPLFDACNLGVGSNCRC
jgi:hypothetical protein